MTLLLTLGCLLLQEPPEGASMNGPWEHVATSDSEICGINTIGKIACTEASWSGGRWVATDREFRFIDGGNGGWCAIDTDGELYCDAFTPPEGPFETVTVSQDGACAQDEWGNALCFGDSNQGDRLTGAPSTPFQSIALGWDFGVGINSQGEVVHWGNSMNFRGDADVPANNSGFYGVAAGFREYVAVGGSESVLLEGSDETVYPGGGSIQGADGSYCLLAGGLRCFGDNNQQQTTPPSGDFVELDMAPRFGCALTEAEGRIQCWGDTRTYPFED